MGSKRRYDIKNAPKEMVENYHDHFDKLRVGSELLNSYKGVPNVHTKLWDKKTLELELADKREQLLELHKRLEDITKDFQYYQRQVVMQGFREPTALPPELLKRKYRLEATYDICLEEIAWLEDKIKNYTETTSNELDRRVLARGLSGGGKLHNGMLAEIFGMKVSKNAEGVLIVDQPNCYLDGMAAVDLRDLSKRWCKARFRLDKEKRQTIQRFHAKGYDAKEIEAEWKTRHDQLFAEHPEWRDLFVVQLPNRPKMPKWPDGIKNYKQNGQPTETEVKQKKLMRRLK